MKLGIVIYSTDAEAVWNAFRLGDVVRAGEIVVVRLKNQT